METVVPSIMPLKFSAIGAPNWALGLILTTIPNLMAAFINPFVSFRSDRLRCKWGRRIPFLAGATPFLVIFLILLGYSEPIGHWLQRTILGGKTSDMAILLAVIGVFMVCFQFFNLFITSVYYYLFNDVVPQALLARFLALFRIVGGCAGAIYSYFILKYANTHMSEIFLASGVLYLVGFGMMCWKVKEGEYPPPPENVDNQNGFIAEIKTFAVECFFHRFYWFFFFANSCAAMTWVSGAYSVLVATKIVGIDLATFGKIGGTCAIISMLLLYPAGYIADRYHPLRVLRGVSIINVLLAPLSITFYFNCHRFSHETAMWIYIGFSSIGLPIATLHNASELPMFMKLLPHERYGQFCSANALVRSCALILGGFACGWFLDLVKKLNPAPEQCYRFVCVWSSLSFLGTLTFLWLLHREWQKLGGAESYEPPRPKKQRVAATVPEEALVGDAR
jgi:Na+/melibiose symporter-like transporter